MGEDVVGFGDFIASALETTVCRCSSLNGDGFECCIMSESFRTLGPGVSLEASKASDYMHT